MTPRLTARQAAIVGAYTGFLAGDFPTLHAYIEEKLGRPVWTHEMGSETVTEEIREATKEDFLAIVAMEEE